MVAVTGDGRCVSCRPFGAFILGLFRYPRLTPWATACRPCRDLVMLVVAIIAGCDC